MCLGAFAVPFAIVFGRIHEVDFQLFSFVLNYVTGVLPLLCILSLSCWSPIAVVLTLQLLPCLTENCPSNVFSTV